MVKSCLRCGVLSPPKYRYLVMIWLPSPTKLQKLAQTPSKSGLFSLFSPLVSDWLCSFSNKKWNSSLCKSLFVLSSLGYVHSLDCLSLLPLHNSLFLDVVPYVDRVFLLTFYDGFQKGGDIACLALRHSRYVVFRDCVSGVLPWLRPMVPWFLPLALCCH